MRAPQAKSYVMIRRATTAAALLVATTVVGCQRTQKEPRAPLRRPAGVVSMVSHYAGAPMSPAGVTTGPSADLDYADALDVRIEWVLLERMPRDLPPLLTRARLIWSPQDADPFRATGRLTRTVGFVPPDKVEAFLADAAAAKFGRRATIAGGTDPSSAPTAVPRGVTARFLLAPPDADPADGDVATTPGIELDVHRPATRATTASASGPAGELLELGVVVTGPRGPGGAGEAGLQRERVVLAPMTVTVPQRFAVVAPSQFGAKETSPHAIAGIVTVAAGQDSPEFEQAVARCKQDLGRASSVAATKPSRQPEIGYAAGYQAALRRLDQPETTRPALAYLASETGADLSSDVALAADDATLAEIARRIETRIKEQSDDARDREHLGWMLESACLEQLAAMRTAEQLPPELSAALSVHAGEAGRRSSSLDELARAGSHDGFVARLTAENLSYLEDASPSARVRAYDWLRTRGRAPAGYDPLGPIKDRRKALDAAAVAAAAANPPPSAAPSAPAALRGSK